MRNVRSNWWVLLGTACYAGSPAGGRAVEGGAATSQSADDDEGTRGGEEATGDAGSTGSSPLDPAQDDSSGEGSSGPVPTDAPLAEAVAVTTIEVNQGVSFAVMREEEFVVDGELIPGRSALVRALWRVDPGFVPRELEGRLLVHNDGVVTTHSQTVSASGAADPSTIQGGFLWEVPAAEVTPTTAIAVEMREIDGASAEPDVGSGARAPIDGYHPLTMADMLTRLEVVVVPMTYAAGGDLAVELTQADIDTIGRALYDEHPVREVTIGVRSPVVYPDPIETVEQFNATLAFLVDLRNSDGASPQAYYAALVDVGCPVVGCGDAGTNGIGVTLADESLGDAELRVSTSLWTDAVTTVDVLVHELGHNHGLRHVPCPNTSPANATADYPYTDGIITGWGWSPMHDTLHGGADYDYMTYCDPSWVSDWTWVRTQARLEAVATLPSPPRRTHLSLVAIVQPDGEHAWFRIESSSRARVRTDGPRLTFFVGGTTVGTAVASRYPMGDGEGELLWVDVPSDAEMFDTLQWDRDGKTETTSAAALRTMTAPSRDGAGPTIRQRAVIRGNADRPVASTRASSRSRGD